MFYGKFEGNDKSIFQDSLKALRRMFGRVYAQDNLIALQRTAGFLTDKRFRAAFDRHAQSDQEKSLGWRLHILTWAAEHCLSVPGDYVECGVYRGFSFAVVADYVNFASVQKNLFLYDTFAGIPEALNSENRSNARYEEETAEDPDAIYSHVVRTFAAYPNIKVVRGIIPDSFAEACPEQIALLHVDLNSSKSEIAALEVLFDKVTPGGFVIFDDYGWVGYQEQKRAEDIFAGDRGHQIVELPTGQGLLIKR